MYKLNFRYLLSLFFLLTFIFTPSLAAHLPYDNVLVFGDSYSDNGNDFQLSSKTYPGAAYYQGRFSDGPTWVEDLRAWVMPSKTSQRWNYAYGQAQVSGDVKIETHKGEKRWSFIVPDLAHEITMLSQSSKQDLSQSLVIVFMGTNDILNLKITPKTDTRHFVQRVFSVEEEQMKRLEKLGAKHILLVSMRDLTETPIVHQQAQDFYREYPGSPSAYYFDTVSSIIQEANGYLISAFKYDPNILIFNAYDFDRRIIKKISVAPYPEQIGGKGYQYIQHVRPPCYINQGNYVDKVGPICKDPEQYFFYDRVHPTRYVHYLMAAAVYDKLKGTSKNSSTTF